MNSKFFTLFLLIISIFFFSNCHSQSNHDIERTKVNFLSLDNKIKKADSLLAIGKYEFASDVYHQAYISAKKRKDSANMEVYLFKRIDAKKYTLDFLSYFSLLDLTEVFCNSKNDLGCKAKINLEYGVYYGEKGEFDLALDYLNTAEGLSKNYQNQDFGYELHRQLGIIYSAMENQEKSTTNFKKALEIALEGKDKVKTAKAFINVGVSLRNKNIDSSIFYGLQAHRLLKDKPFITQKIFHASNLSQMYLVKDDPQSALKILKSTINLDSLANQDLPMHYQRLMYSVGDTYSRLKEFTTSNRFLYKALDCTNKEWIGFQIDVRELLLNNYKELGNTLMTERLSYDIEMLKKIGEINDKMSEVSVKEKKTELDKRQVKIDALKEKNIEVKKESVFNRRLAYQFGAVIFCVLFILLFTTYRNRITKYKIQERLVVSRLSSLHSSMNPHFLFNTFSTLQNYILKRDNSKAHLFMIELSSHIRDVFNSSESTTIDFNSEMKIIKGYIKLQSDRFENRFGILYKIDKTIELTNPQIPSMMIQPFVENAIIHGFSKKSSKNQLIISAEEKENDIEIRVIDNGVGRIISKKNKEKNAVKNNLSIATKNTIERLDILNKLYNGKSSITINDLKNRLGDSMGTEVIIKLSFVLKK